MVTTRAREEAIAIETLKNLREKVSWCQRANPVTHYYKCADIVGKYMELIRVSTVQGVHSRCRVDNSQTRLT